MAYQGSQQPNWQGPGYQYPYGQGPGSSAPPPPAGFRFQDPEANKYEPFSTGGDYGFEFNEQGIRRGFIRKVYSILMCQILITVGFIALFLYNEGARNYTQKNPGLFVAALVLTFILIIAMACCESVRRKAPMNFIFLALFTVCEGFLLGVASSTYKADAVLLAAIITTVICLSLTAFSFQTKWDVTGYGTYLFIALIVLVLFGFLAMFIPGSYGILNIVYACFGALLFSFYLVYDTQLMLGGHHKYSISPEEYIFAALNLYLDIVNIFIYILQIIGSSRD